MCANLEFLQNWPIDHIAVPQTPINLTVSDNEAGLNPVSPLRARKNRGTGDGIHPALNPMGRVNQSPKLVVPVAPHGTSQLIKMAAHPSHN